MAEAGSRKRKFKLRLDDWSASDSASDEENASGVVALRQKDEALATIARPFEEAAGL